MRTFGLKARHGIGPQPVAIELEVIAIAGLDAGKTSFEDAARSPLQLGRGRIL